MSIQWLATVLLLPPVGLVLAALALLAWRGRRAAPVVALLLVVMLALATPFAAGALRISLERSLHADVAAAPGAIVVLSGDIAETRNGIEIGPLTLERIRAGAALHRRTGLPLLVSGGIVSRRHPVPVATLMAEAFARDFAVTVRWVETRSRDTRENAEASAVLLAAEGIGAVHLVSHAWHLPRAHAAFARAGMGTVPAPVRLGPEPELTLSDLVPSPRAMLDSWYFLREWAGMLVYRLRDG